MFAKFRQLAHPTERIIWVVAFASIAQSLLQAIEAGLDHSRPKVLLWVIGSIWIGAMAGWAETVKLRAGE
ncbi:MAG: hypothetical protein AABY18_00130 [Candidatus Thermoplasmatota archaeon]